MAKDSPPGRLLAIDYTAKSTKKEVPGFLSKPPGAPVYHGFRILTDVEVDGFLFGMITDFEAGESNEGDAFVVAPDNSRAGLVWSVGHEQNFTEILPIAEDRWGVWLVSFPYPMTTHDHVRLNLRAILPLLKPNWERWKRTYSHGE
ncbi:MAG TPA: hypothetical protein VGN17_11235 [Bryobacteraceae bacterium]|jgi:hypothetical protein